MAIHFKKLGPRAASALIFVIVLLASVLTSYLTFTLFFLLVSILGLMEYFILCEKFGVQANKLLGFLSGVVIYTAFIDPWELGLSGVSNLFYDFLIIIPFLLVGAAVFRKGPKPFSAAIYTLGGLAYCVLPFGLLHCIVLPGTESSDRSYNPAILIGIILLIWANDTFAYLGGSMFGKHKMIERVSPGKTWEGTVAGIVAAFAGSFIVAGYTSEDDSLFWMVAGLSVPVLATIGDLAQSTLKREADVKDTGRIMPGHGGILDRFDSLIFICPFVVLVLKLIATQCVSG